MLRLAVRNWAKFQHYKHRCPPWIKLAADTFQNPEFACLQDACKLLAVCIWTLASRSQDGTIPDNFDYIKQWGFLGKDVKKEHLMQLIEAGFLVELADCKQDASTLHTNAASETEKSRDRVETETDGYKSYGHFNSIEAAMGYCHTFSVVGQKNYDAIRQAIELAKAGPTEFTALMDDYQDIANRMIDSRRKYESMTGKKFEYPAVSFITSGIWKTPRKWKNGKSEPTEEELSQQLGASLR